jgi:sucrose-phosphate synthase
MHISFINPQGNFDPHDSYWTEHPDFGGQLVYVKQVAIAMGESGHKVDILTRQIIDPNWPEFAATFDSYPHAPNVRIIRLPAGPKEFLRKELLWPHLINDWVPNILEFYKKEKSLPDALTTHYGDGGLCGSLIEIETGVPFTFTAHSLGAQKMDKLHITRPKLAEMNERFNFARRIVAERLAMNHSIINITSTQQERYNQYSHNAYRGAVDWTDDSRFSVIPPGVNLDIFDRSVENSDEKSVHAHIERMLHRDLDTARVDLPCIVASSRLDPKKNHRGLVEAFAYSPELRQRANLVIITGNIDNPLKDYKEAGDTEKVVLEDMIDIINQSQLEGQVSMFALRGQDQLAAGYRFFAKRHSVFALTALYEPFGLAPLEAMAAGMPVVVTKFGGPSESLREEDQEYGILVDPSNPEEVSAAFFTLVANRDQWQHYAKLGYDRVQSRYTWKRTAEGYIKSIQQAIEVPAAHRTKKKLSIHPYFQDPQEKNDITLEDLDDLYFKLEVLSVGETLVDFISVKTSNSLRTADQFTRYLGGQPANVAVYVAKLGARSAIVSKIGNDRFGEFLEEQLQFNGVNTEALLRTGEMPTTSNFLTKTIRVPDFQVNRGADYLLTFRDVDEELIDRAKIVQTSCFALSREPSRSAIRRALRLAHRKGKLIALDPNYSPRVWPDKLEAWEVLAQILPYVTIVKPSLEDARRLFDPNMDEQELETASLREFHNLGAEIVIVTRSGGMVSISDGETVETVGPLKMVEVESVIGGSDAFWAGLFIARLDGKSLPVCVKFAHEVAARKLSIVGHVEKLIDRMEIYEKLENEININGSK